MKAMSQEEQRQREKFRCVHRHNGFRHDKCFDRANNPEHIIGYLDIETTGLSYQHAEITVVGIYLVNGNDTRLVQLVGGDVTTNNLLGALDGVDTIYTYNGRRFDLPFIHASLGIDLKIVANHHDLMYDCWKCNLYGGFKAVERQLGIKRRLISIDGYHAVRLWCSPLLYCSCSSLQIR